MTAGSPPAICWKSSNGSPDEHARDHRPAPPANAGSTSGHRLGHGFDDAPRRCADRHRRPALSGRRPWADEIDSRSPFRTSRILVKSPSHPTGGGWRSPRPPTAGTALFLRRFESTTPELFEWHGRAPRRLSGRPTVARLPFSPGDGYKKISVTWWPRAEHLQCPQSGGRNLERRRRSSCFPLPVS